nr:MAG TPA: hypothetical protein [Caudoviricetes sp.]
MQQWLKWSRIEIIKNKATNVAYSKINLTSPSNHPSSY